MSGDSKRKKNNTPLPMNTLTVAFIAILVSVIGNAVYHYKFADHVHASDASMAAKGILVVDTERVLTAFMEIQQEKVLGGEEISMAEHQMAGNRFGAEYMRVLKHYRDQGYLVVDRKSVLAIPTDSEITEEFATRLDLTVERAPDPFTLAELK